MTEIVEQNILINSLVTLNISDHWTRCRVQNGPSKVFGALLGKQSGRSVHILNSFEVNTLLLDGIYTIDEEYFSARAALFKETFAELEFVGFYRTCVNHEETNHQDVQLQRQAMRFNESPLLLKLNAERPICRDKISMNVFECATDPANEANITFHQLPIKIITELSEQIGLDHVARLSKTGGVLESTASRYLTSHFGAINTLLQGITTMQNYLRAVRLGEVERDPIILKDIHKLCRKISSEKPTDLQEIENSHISDQKLLVLLCLLTNTHGVLAELITKTNSIMSERYPTNALSSGITAKKSYHQKAGNL